MRRAFTLIELLVSMVIVGILASLILFALASVTESAKRDKTISTISKLNSLVMAKYESYRTRRASVDPKQVAAYRNYNASPTGWAQAHVDVIRDLMRLEMPDRYSDIQDDPATKYTGSDGLTHIMARPSVNTAYLAALPTSPNMKFEGAKCLYLFVTHGLDDPDVMSQFSEDEIAKDDIDGLRYFVDGWGQPIFFLRWAPGFSSPLQPWNVNPADVFNNQTVTKVYPATHDPFDPLHAYRPGVGDPFYNPDSTVTASSQVYPPLCPLILSGGPDQITDIYMNGIDPTQIGAKEFRYSQTNPPNNPYALVNGGLFGASTDLPSIFTPANITTNQQGDGIDNSIDNITNHDLSATQ